MILNFGGVGWVLMLVFGIWTLRSGRFYLAPNCMVQGRLTRVIGWLFMLPLAICLSADALIAATFGRGEGANAIGDYVAVSSWVVALICPVVAVALALGFGRPPRGEVETADQGWDEEEAEADGEETRSPTTRFRIIRREGRRNRTDDRFRE